MNNFLVPADRKGGKVLMSDGFRYRRKSRPSAKFHWICTDNACGARLSTISFDYDRENIVGKYSIFHSFSLES
jgi:FLYWCH zinc finger domain